MSNQFELLKQRRFRPLFMTQFLGAFNDNVFKTALITLVAFRTSQLTSADSSTLVTILPGVFILPFFLFSATAGQIADKLEKSNLVKNIKLFEIFIMLFASIGFLLNNIILLGLALFLMGIQSAIFGPVKYAYLPQHLKEDELIGGNGMLEMGTFVAILIGQILGAWLATQHTSEIMTSICVITLAAAGYWSSLDIPNSPAGAPQLTINWNPMTETVNNLKFIWQHQSLWLAIVGISWFWFVGATLLAQFPNFARSTLHGDESVFILMLSVFSLGIGIGSLSCEKLSKHKVELGLVLLGGIGLILFCTDLYLTSTHISVALVGSTITRSYTDFLLIASHYHLLADILLIGIFGGFYIVPLYAYIQSHAEKSHQSRVIAGNNIMNALFMVISAIFSLWIFKLGYSIPELFLATAIISTIVIAYLSIRQPAYLSSFFNWIKAISNQ
ncbi:MAG: MFS transporter [Methylophilaceae bacterium]